MTFSLVGFFSHRNRCYSSYGMTAAHVVNVTAIPAKFNDSLHLTRLIREAWVWRLERQTVTASDTPNLTTENAVNNTTKVNLTKSHVHYVLPLPASTALLSQVYFVCLKSTCFG